MAIFHMRIKVFSRGHSNIFAVACYRFCGRISDRQTGQKWDFRAKSPTLVASWLTGWDGSRSGLWNKVEQTETRKNAALAREIEVSIPRELTDEQGAALCRRFTAWLSQTYGVAIDANIHRPGRRENNPHCHILMSTRRVNADMTRGAFGEKTREWDELGKIEKKQADGTKIFIREGRGRATIQATRAKWEELANAALEAAGFDERIDRRSLAEQGIDREPIHYSRNTIELEKREGTITPQAEEMGRRKRRNKLRPARRKAGRALPVPHIEREEIREVPAIDREQTHTRETLRRDARREIERGIIRSKHRAATAAERAQNASTDQPEARRPKAPPPLKERRKGPTL
jgi:hypothetical protein